MKIDILAIGKIAKTPFDDLCKEYMKRTSFSISIKEFEIKSSQSALKKQIAECEKLQSSAVKDSLWIGLDARGKSFNSIGFSSFFENHKNKGHSHFSFFLGGADGFTEEFLTQMHTTLSFGDMTWPHKLARVMLMEQLYRADQIRKGTPYHH